MENVIQAVLNLFRLEVPAGAHLWHKWETGLFVRTIDGHITTGDVWRRRANDQWQYQTREVDADEWLGRQI